MNKKDFTQVLMAILFISAIAFRFVLFYLDCNYSTDTQMIFPYTN